MTVCRWYVQLASVYGTGIFHYAFIHVEGYKNCGLFECILFSFLFIFFITLMSIN